jgi:hypothetical protein
VLLTIQSDRWRSAGDKFDRARIDEATSMSKIKLTELAQIAEIIAAVAVVLSLIYVGKEVQSNTAAVRGAAMQAVATTDADALMTIAADATLSEIVRLGHLDHSQLSPPDAHRYKLFMTQFWLNYQNIYQQSELGLIDQSVWRSYVSIICRMAARQGAQDTWPDHASVLDPAFVAVVEECE